MLSICHAVGIAVGDDGVGAVPEAVEYADGGGLLGIDGVKHPLALVQGATENATLVTELLVDLRERGLDVTRPMLVGLDGSKALRKAVLDVLDHPVIQRCQLHKIQNVKDRLPQRLRSSAIRRMADAYHAAPQRWRPKSRCCPWPKSLTARTPRRQPVCVRACTRPSRCCGWTLRPRWRGRCVPRMSSSR